MPHPSPPSQRLALVVHSGAVQCCVDPLQAWTNEELGHLWLEPGTFQIWYSIRLLRGWNIMEHDDGRVGNHCHVEASQLIWPQWAQRLLHGVGHMFGRWALCARGVLLCHQHSRTNLSFSGCKMWIWTGIVEAASSGMVQMRWLALKTDVVSFGSTLHACDRGGHWVTALGCLACQVHHLKAPFSVMMAYRDGMIPIDPRWLELGASTHILLLADVKSRIAWRHGRHAAPNELRILAASSQGSESSGNLGPIWTY